MNFAILQRGISERMKKLQPIIHILWEITAPWNAGVEAKNVKESSLPKGKAAKSFKYLFIQE